MKGLLLLLWVLLVGFPAVSQDEDNVLVYEEGKKLTWNDFKGAPKYSDQSKGAQLTVTLNLKVKKYSFWSGKATYDVYALAYTNNSWVKPAYRDAYTLAHEQLHFDIAHIYAETLEGELNALDKSAAQKDQVQIMLNKAVTEMSAYQALYDRESRGGNNKAKQKEWARKVKEDLEVVNANG